MPISDVASTRAGETWIGCPFSVAPPPRAAVKASSRDGSNTHAATGPSGSSTATDTAHCGKP